jgi:hypothetical protein
MRPAKKWRSGMGAVSYAGMAYARMHGSTRVAPEHGLRKIAVGALKLPAESSPTPPSPSLLRWPGMRAKPDQIGNFCGFGP